MEEWWEWWEWEDNFSIWSREKPTSTFCTIRSPYAHQSGQIYNILTASSPLYRYIFRWVQINWPLVGADGLHSGLPHWNVPARLGVTGTYWHRVPYVLHQSKRANYHSSRVPSTPLLPTERGKVLIYIQWLSNLRPCRCWRGHVNLRGEIDQHALRIIASPYTNWETPTTSIAASSSNIFNANSLRCLSHASFINQRQTIHSLATPQPKAHRKDYLLRWEGPQWYQTKAGATVAVSELAGSLSSYPSYIYSTDSVAVSL